MSVAVYRGEALARYSFGSGHPFGPRRHDAFWDAFAATRVARRVTVRPPVSAGRADLELFHEPAYLDLVERLSASGEGLLDRGDTPAFRGMWEASLTVAGTALDALEWVLDAKDRRAFVPIAGLHHAFPGRAGGFCVVNDCGIAIAAALARHGMERVAYVDVDGHHGDGVYGGFAAEPRVVIADVHEDGRYLFPGTGRASERGVGPGEGTVLNVPMRPSADDEAFFAVWQDVERFVARTEPQLIVLQCGADGLESDPLTHLRYTEAVHRRVTADLVRVARRSAGGRVLALGGGGYDLGNLGLAWTEVVRALLDA